MGSRSERTVSDQQSEGLLPGDLGGLCNGKSLNFVFTSKNERYNPIFPDYATGSGMSSDIFTKHNSHLYFHPYLQKRMMVWPSTPFKGVTAIRASSTPTDFAGFCFKSHRTNIPHKTLLRKRNQKICWKVFASEQDKCVGRHVDKTQMFPSSKRKHNINSEALMSKIFKEKIKVKKLE